MEEKVYKSNKISLNLLAKLKDAEMELGKWPKLFTQVTFAGPYAYNAVKNDQIDLLLADFINVHPSRGFLKLFFKRESEGIYQFNTKRLNIKIENGSLKCRVGGGYLSIDEFVEQYLPIELEKCDNTEVPWKWKELSEKQHMAYQQNRVKSPNIRQRSHSPNNISPKKLIFDLV